MRSRLFLAFLLGVLLVACAAPFAPNGAVGGHGVPQGSVAASHVTVVRASDGVPGTVNVFVDGRFRSALPQGSFVSVALCANGAPLQLTSLASPVESNAENALQLKTLSTLEAGAKVHVRKLVNRYVEAAVQPSTAAQNLSGLKQQQDLLPRGLTCA